MVTLWPWGAVADAHEGTRGFKGGPAGLLRRVGARSGWGGAVVEHGRHQSTRAPVWGAVVSGGGLPSGLTARGTSSLGIARRHRRGGRHGFFLKENLLVTCAQGGGVTGGSSLPSEG